MHLHTETLRLYMHYASPLIENISDKQHPSHIACALDTQIVRTCRMRYETQPNKEGNGRSAASQEEFPRVVGWTQKVEQQ